LLCLVAVASRNVRADAIDDFVESRRQAMRIPGLAVLVVDGGKVAKAQGYGLANVEHQVPVTAETVFQLGSIGKQFTATAVMLLIEDGRLQLDTPVASVLTGAPESWQSMTVRHLLSHTAGVGGLDNGFDFTRNYSDEELLQIIYRSPLKFAPGTDWQYSNPGYVTLGLLIERVCGKHYGELLAERVFRPLEMKATRIISEADIVPHRAAGYRLEKGQLKNQKWVSPSLNTTADGSLYTNLLDMARWDAALRGHTLLKPESIEAMWTPQALSDGKVNRANYGLGWMIGQVDGRRVVRHGGAWQGFTSHIVRFLDEPLTVLLLANLSSDSFQGLPELAEQIAGKYQPAIDPTKAP